MGLDIVAYSKLRRVEAPEASDHESGGWPTIVRIRQELLDVYEREFPGRAAGLTAGVFAFDDSMHFRAGSYSGCDGERHSAICGPGTVVTTMPLPPSWWRLW